MSAVTTTSFAHASEHTFSSVTEVQEFQEDSDQYKFCLFPSEDGDIEIRIETHKGSDLTLNKNGTLTITGPSGDSGIEIPSMTEVTGRYPDAKVGQWEVDGNSAVIQITSPPDVKKDFREGIACGAHANADNASGSSTVKQSYSACMLEHGIKGAVAGAIAGCAAGAFAAGAGCVAAILPGMSAGYISSAVVALWDCRDKL